MAQDIREARAYAATHELALGWKFVDRPDDLRGYSNSTATWYRATDWAKHPRSGDISLTMHARRWEVSEPDKIKQLATELVMSDVLIDVYLATLRKSPAVESVEKLTTEYDPERCELTVNTRVTLHGTIRPIKLEGTFTYFEEPR
jgi:hypothetical protein